MGGLHKKGAMAGAKGLRRCWSLVQRIQNCVRSSARDEGSLEYKRRPAERGHRENAKKRAAPVPRQASLQKRVHKRAARALVSGATTAVEEKPNDLKKPGVYMTWDARECTHQLCAPWPTQGRPVGSCRCERIWPQVAPGMGGSPSIIAVHVRLLAGVDGDLRRGWPQEAGWSEGMPGGQAASPAVLSNRPAGVR